MLDNKENKDQSNAALDMIKAIYEDKCATINERDYKFSERIAHGRRLKVFAFYTKIAKQLEANDMSFLGTVEFEAIDKLISEVVTYDDNVLSKLRNHWEDYPQDYITFINTAIVVLSYPFFKGNPQS